jgi:glycosyltransferase involved in cell wall biosynthesis
MPSVSVIVPTFNRTRFLKLAIESVVAQTQSDWELVIADDGSEEETKAYLRSIRGSQVQIIWLGHSGNPSLVRNAALAAAQGHYVGFLDSDDIWAPSKLAKQIQALSACTGSRWSYTACAHIDENGRTLLNARARTFACRSGWIFEPLLKLEVAIAMPSVLAERDLIKEVGGFDEQQRFGEFHDLCLRLALKSEVVAVAEPLCWVRTHNEHYSADRIEANVSWMRLYEKMAALAPNPRLRAYCARMRARTSLAVARLHGSRGNYGTVWRTLRRAAPFSWRYPEWWLGVCKGIARAVVRRAQRK